MMHGIEPMGRCRNVGRRGRATALRVHCVFVLTFFALSSQKACQQIFLFVVENPLPRGKDVLISACASLSHTPDVSAPLHTPMDASLSAHFTFFSLCCVCSRISHLCRVSAEPPPHGSTGVQGVRNTRVTR